MEVVADVLERLPAALRRLYPEGRPFVLTHASLWRLFGSRLHNRTRTVITLPEGERSKSVASLETLWRRMVAAGCDRRSVCVILGGGVLGDLGGFAASTYMRGIPVVQVPTTLLAMVDSAIGGKTAVNLPEGKNLVGTFHQPRLVWCDLRLLATLPVREVRSGFGEILKYAVLDRGVYRMLELGKGGSVVSAPFPATPFTRKLVLTCAARKLWVVARDQFERVGVRESLNLGHTVGHAIETATGYGVVSHGEAVALGLIAEINLARRLQVCPQHDAQRALTLVTRYLPPAIFARMPLRLSDAELIALMRRDKKARAGRLRFALPRRIGVVDTFDDVPVRQVKCALEDVRTWLAAG